MTTPLTPEQRDGLLRAMIASKQAIGWPSHPLILALLDERDRLAAERDEAVRLADESESRRSKMVLAKYREAQAELDALRTAAQRAKVELIAAVEWADSGRYCAPQIEAAIDLLAVALGGDPQ